MIDNALRVQQFSGPIVRVLPGQAAWLKEKVYYTNDDWLWVEVPNNRRSRVVVRMDRKRQRARIQAVPVSGWRYWLERLYNWCTRRYDDIALALVECQEWTVTEVIDLRESPMSTQGAA